MSKIATYTFNIEIKEGQTDWGQITNKISLKTPAYGFVLLNALNSDLGIMRNVYVRPDGLLFNCAPALTTGTWYINGAYISK